MAGEREQGFGFAPPQDVPIPYLQRIRDYYRVEDNDGLRFWIYREGFFRPDRPPRWWLHGMFG